MRATSTSGVLIVSLLAVPGLCRSASGDIVVDYVAANSSSIAPTTQGAGVTGSNLTGASGLIFAGNGFEWSGWETNSLANAITANEYLEWGFTSTQTYDLSDLDIRYDALGNGPENLAIQASINGGGFQTIYTDDAVATGGFDAANIDLSSFASVTSAVFRLFAWNANNANGRLNVENSTSFGNAAIVVNGVAIPEPASLVMMGLAGCAWVVCSRWRQ
ncbi:MAG: PEP-CTERM sorting domain-containing protein, partial [Planctomycetaceae bacterium]